jgi:lysophospholipid acyltransferase (LPLAT)-like uncharacterized protein
LRMKKENEKKRDGIRFRLKQLRRRITYSNGFLQFAAFLAYILIYLYFRTLKVRYHFHPEFLELDRNKVFFGFWHGRQFLLIPSFGHWNATLITDISWAGEIQTRILQRFGYIVVRGSSKRKGVQALLHVKREAENGHSAAFALDGPSGPIHQAKPGILFLARKMHYPIIPLTSGAKNAWTLENTWCRYLFPKPFSRCFVAMGKPVWIEETNEEVLIQNLNRTMNQWTQYVDRKFGEDDCIIEH